MKLNRNRLLAAIVVFVALLVVLGLSLGSIRGQPRINQRSPISHLGYCSSNADKPCIISFSLDTYGRMLVNVLTPGPSYPKFYLKITHSMGASNYRCRSVEGFSAIVTCVGEEMRPGVELQFALISADEDRILAQGSFAIVGLALATPGISASSTPVTPQTPSPTLDLFARTPTPTRRTPTTSYPNPYPNPSYP